MLTVPRPRAVDAVQRDRTPIDITAPMHSVRRNILRNLAGQIVPLVVGLVTVPVALSRLGNYRFGLLSLAWLMLGYLGLFDFGIGRATVHYTSRAVAAGDEEGLRGIVWSSVAFNTAVSTVVAFLLYALARPHLTWLLHPAPAVRSDCEQAFFWVCAGVPIVTISACLRAVLEGAHRFDMTNLIQVPAACSNYIIPAVGARYSLTTIICLLILVRMMTAAGYALVVLHLYPFLLRAPASSRVMARRLLSFGGWSTISSVISPLLLYSDRFIISAMLSPGSLAFYVAPSEALARLLVVPSAVATTTLPAVSAEPSGVSRPAELCFRTLRYVALMLFPPVAFLALFAPELLGAWLGPAYAIHSARVFSVLALAMAVNGCAMIPFTLLTGSGRPDITAKLHLAEAAIFVALAYYMVQHYGLLGAAVAWLARVSCDALAMLIAAQKISPAFRSALRAAAASWEHRRLAILLAVTAVAAVGFGNASVYVKASILLTLSPAFVVVGWQSLDSADTALLARFWSRMTSGREIVEG